MVAKNSVVARLDRSAVLDAACDILDRDGFESLTLVTLASELDRHASSLYNHVEGLEGLRRDVTARSLEDLGARLWRAVLGKGGEEGLRAIADAYRVFALEHPGRFEAATAWQERLPRDERSLRLVQPAADAIHAVMASFDLDDTAVAHATRVFTSSVVGFIRAAGRTFDGPPPREETFDALIDLFVLGLTGGSWLRVPD